jgi:hypothetical protein
LNKYWSRVAMTETIAVPCQTFFYRELPRDGEAGGALYQMEAILPSAHDVFYSAILRSCALSAADLAQLQLLDDLLIPDCNAQSIRLLFATLDQGAFLCGLTAQGTLRVLEHLEDAPGHTDTSARANALLPCVDSKYGDVCSAMVYSLIHHFHETRERVYAHEGIALVPSYILGMPVFLTQERLQALLHDWSTRLLALARSHALYVVTPLQPPQQGSEPVLRRAAVHAVPTRGLDPSQR